MPVSLQLLVIMAMIFFFFPASKPVRDFKAMTIGQLHQQQQPAAAAVAGNGAYIYNIVLDAGSTGSRIHIFKFQQQGSSLNLISDGFHQLKPGLSAFPDEPQKAADSLKPLLEEAMKAVPAAQQVRQGCSTCTAGAAAGAGHAAPAAPAHA
jgi:Golgi nucleoside diphosphatase